MKSQYGFTEFENLSEFKTWIYKQKVTRTITRLQVHHTAAPSYANWATDNALRRQYNMKNFHVKTNGWADIAQQFTIFPDGHIVTGRSLNSTPVGITGWNTNAICVEIYGNFDTDTMTVAQKNAVLGCYKIMAERFNISIDLNHIRPHAFFTAKGSYLGKYIAGKSTKTCPGKNFFGGINNFQSFLNQVKAFDTTSLKAGVVEETVDYSKYGKYIGDEAAVKAVQEDLKELGYYTDSIDGSYGPNMYKAVTNFQKDNGLDVDGWVGEATKAAIKTALEKKANESKSYVAGVYKVLVDSLNVRLGPGTSYDVSGRITDKGKYTIVEVQNGWGKLKSGAGWICLDDDYCELVTATVTKKKMIKNISSEAINVRSTADWNGKVVTTLAPGASVTYADGPLTAANGSTKMYKTVSGTYITASEKYVQIIEV